MSHRPPIKLLHIISGDLWAGAESMAYQLLSGLNQLDSIDLYLIILNKGRLEQLCRQSGINYYLIDEQKLSFAAIVLKAIKIARKIHPDIIHSHRYKENIIAALVSLCCGNPKRIATQHGRTEADKNPFPKNILGQFNRACLRWLFVQVVAVSSDTADYLMQGYGLRSSSITVIPNGIVLPTKPKPPKTDGGFRSITVGSAGRLFPVKQYEVFVDIARRVCRVKPETRFVIAGDGPERVKLEALTTRYELNEKVRFLGHTDNMQAFYNSLDLYINTSAHEGAPMTILEAMATWLPVIAFNVAGLKEIIADGSDGFTIPEGQNDLFASRILELASHPEGLTALGKNARQKVLDHFSTKKMVGGYLALYQRIIRF